MIAPGIRADDVVTIIASGLFDPEWYARVHRDVTEQGVEPLAHFLTQGWRERRSPGPDFDLAWYETTYADRLPADTNPLLHYLVTGWRDGLRPAPAFDPVAYLAEHPEASGLDVSPIVHQLAVAHASRSSAATPHGQRAVHTGRPGWSPADLDARSDAPAAAPPAATTIQLIAHYLPQFHAVPENDAWWGDGFTEWTNVRRGEPRFPGHYQPHVPIGEGYYDLDDAGVLARQARLARLHGITAFAFYSYWFEGRRILEKPVQRFADDPTIDLGYCVIWANESWTRTWDGVDGAVLVEQTYSAEDDLAFIAAHARYLRDPRYVRVDGRPVLGVYRAESLPDPRATAQRWRDWCRAAGIGDIHLVAVHAESTIDPALIGFDAAMEFWPNDAHLSDVTAAVAGSDYRGRVFDWTELVQRSERYAEPTSTLYRGVCTTWDSEARRPGWGTALHGATPDLFRQWLSHAAADTVRRFPEPSQRLVFVNAWNEWAEGCHLEPDERYGYRWLHAARDVQQSLSGAPPDPHPGSAAPAADAVTTGVVVVTHDLHPHGAQFGSLALVRTLADLGIAAEAVALGHGALEPDFRALGPLHLLADQTSPDEASAMAGSLRRRGFTTALVNSVAGEWFARHLRDAGLHVVMLVHEMPALLTRHELTESAARASGSCDEMVFASSEVLSMFPGAAGLDPTKVRILPQGLYRRGLLELPLDDRARAKSAIGLPADEPLVIGVGYGDHRKGFDRFVDIALRASMFGDATRFAWIGHLDHFDDGLADARARASSLANLEVTGFVDDPGRWYAAADALLLPSREDPFPSVVLEAAACGLGTVAFAGATGMAGAIADLHGRVVPDDAGAALAAVHELIESDAAAGALRREQRRSSVEWNYSHHRYVLDLLAVTPAAVPRVSVVVPAYRHVDYIEERLTSILGQDHPLYEVLVVDDASDDETAAVARRVLHGHDVAWSVRANEHNSGLVWRQWAACAAAARGDLVWIAESDDAAEPTFVSALTARIEATGAVAAFCQSRPIDSGGAVLGPDYRDYLGRWVPGVDWSRPETITGASFAADLATTCNPILTVSSVIARTADLEGALAACAVLLPEHPTTGDWLVYAALARRGDLAYEPQPLCLHRRHDQSVIGGADPARHLAEIRRTQQALLDDAGAGEEVRARARAYLDDVARRLGVVAA